MPRTYSQAKYWLLTIPQHLFIPYLPPNAEYIGGQLESGGETGYLHWQVLVCFKQKLRLAGVKSVFGESIHAEPSKSDAAREYVFKEDTRVEGTGFTLGQYPFRRNNDKDWEAIFEAAKLGRLADIPADVRLIHYNSIRRIHQDNLQPIGIEKRVQVYWGPTGVGKSRRAWEEAGLDAYPKDPRTKFWDGYNGQQHVVIDEFRGGIDISHILRWLDRYPTIVEVKGSSTVLKATHIWITTNLEPARWYPDLDNDTLAALMRRLEVSHLAEAQYEDIE